jgi:hypothetical protein
LLKARPEHKSATMEIDNNWQILYLARSKVPSYEGIYRNRVLSSRRKINYYGIWTFGICPI